MTKRFVLIMIITFLFLSSFCFGADVRFQWDANTETDLAKYKLYQAETAGGPYIKAQVVGEGNLVAIILVDLAAIPPVHPTEYTLENVADGQHYWVLTAADVSNNESGFSNEVNAIIDSVPPAPPGGLSIWQIIVAWIKNILSWFA